VRVSVMNVVVLMPAAAYSSSVSGRVTIEFDRMGMI
jgi:hypothetical protein